MAASTAMILVACGGGSSSPPVAPVKDANELTTSVPAPTYPAGSSSPMVFNAVNTLREQMGAGLLTQNDALDKAALAHWNYVNANADANGPLQTHYEIKDNTGFTGVDPTARVQHFGYNGTAAEVMYGQTVADKPEACSASWLNSVYHVSVLFTGARDVGVSAQTTVDYPNYGKYTVCVVVLGLLSSGGEQLPVDGTIRVYPNAGQTKVPLVFFNHTETPTPLPDLPEVGTPVSLNFKTKSFAAAGASAVISISQFTLTPPVGAALDVKILTNKMTSTGPLLTDDINVDPFTATLVPTARLQANTLYSVSFAGSVNGKAVSKNWSFTTGNDITGE